MTANEFINQVEQCQAAGWKGSGLINTYMFERISRHLKTCEHCRAGFDNQFDLSFREFTLNDFDRFFTESNNLENWTCESEVQK